MPPSDTTFLLAAYAVQGAGCLLLAAVIASLWRTYRRNYFVFVGLSWLSLGLVYTSSGVALLLVNLGVPDPHPAHIGASTTALVASYLLVALLFAATYEVASGRRSRKGLLVAAITALVLIGIISPWLYLNDPNAGMTRIFIRFGVRSLATGLAFIGAGAVLWRVRRRNGLGSQLVAIGFVLYGAQNLHFFALTLRQLMTSRFVSYGALLTVIDFFFLIMIGIGTIVWLLEVERDRVVHSAREVERLSNFDSMTGLPNRSRFLNSCCLELEAIPEDNQAVMLAIDVDNFRAFNDTMGRATGDELLRMLAQRIQDWLDRPALTARIGSDEFAALIKNTNRLGGPDATVAGLQEVIRRPYSVLGRELLITASVGIARYPRDARDSKQLLRKAEAALHGAQRHGRDESQHYTPALDSLSSDRLRFESSLRRAFGEGQFILFYQPIVSLKDLRPEAFEALIRWNHPTRGLIPPAEFLGVAEDIGLLNQLEWWVLETACRDLHGWLDQGLADLRVSVNLTPQRFLTPNMVRHTLDIIDQTGVSPDHVQLEVTEGSVFQHTESTLGVLSGLRKHGIRIAIDDFGTGYASLGSLRHFPVDVLKMDRVFIRELGISENGDAFVNGIMTLAHALQLPVVAEGVERSEERDALRRMGCDSAQGFLFGKPQPLEAWRETELVNPARKGSTSGGA